MAARCPECGAALPEGGACVDLFHSLLLLEHEMQADPGATAGGRGQVAHFHAVSSYVLQHPEGMGYNAESLAGLRRGLADQLAGRITLAEHRRRVRHASDGATRVIRRAGDVPVRWPVERWPMTVRDILDGGVAGYADRVAAWAGSILDALERAGA